jgi:hypothetical protein
MAPVFVTSNVKKLGTARPFERFPYWDGVETIELPPTLGA